MTTFSVTFYTAGEYAEQDIEAATAQEALQLAQGLWEAERYELDFDNYDDLQELQTIRIDGPDQASSLEWETPERMLARAGNDMLNALEKAIEALNTAPRFKVPGLDTDSYAIAALCDQAVALAKGRGQ